jgi:hypothetical protein
MPNPPARYFGVSAAGLWRWIVGAATLITGYAPGPIPFKRLFRKKVVTKYRTRDARSLAGPILKLRQFWNNLPLELFRFSVLVASAECIMRKTSRTPVVVTIDYNVVRLQRRGAAASDGDESSPVAVETLAALMERASNAARQMRYFRLMAKRASFNDLLPSAKRAGFTQLVEDTQRKEAKFQWSGGEQDFIFFVSLNDSARASIVAESCGDIFGLILTGYSHVANISVETNPSLETEELGRNALMFRDMLLTFPDFDGMPAWTKYW